MKTLVKLALIALLATGCYSGNTNNNANKQRSLDKATAAIRDAFARGNVPAIVALHSPNIVKYFGGSNVIIGRAALAQNLTQMFKYHRMQFVENKVENTIFVDSIAIQSVIFTFKLTPVNGGKPTLGRGRSMVVYVQDNHSPTGWYSLREMAQAAPDK